ncbi:DUF362 domain-containing protein [Bacteroidetes/Chlorobi group bacterium ChocPot_Mid]|nr:MAG: DUF362 domain-containing protein [Bacteroidetes/Chlorobi group bacterium ChocPot_Mid]
MKSISRREFVKKGASLALAGSFLKYNFAKAQNTNVIEKPKTNIADAFKYPKTQLSLPGKYSGKVVEIQNEMAINNGKFDYEEISFMIDQAMLILTEKKNNKEAWSQLFSPTDRIGIKVNPVGGKLLSTSHEVVRTVISELVNIGVPLENIIIWDRREFQLFEAGFTPENFPAVQIIGTERKDKQGSFYDENGQLYSESMIDKDWFYWADIDGVYDSETLPYMVNGGKYSYFTKIVTQMVDKIINIPVLKNAGTSITGCLKNIAYGSITNTGRLHKQLWAETSAEVPCFPPIRDKLVLNIMDGIRGCYDGGPGAKPEFITDYNTILLSSDPVAVDRISLDIVLNKRREMGVQKDIVPSSYTFLQMAEKNGLGNADLNNIQIRKMVL